MKRIFVSLQLILVVAIFGLPVFGFILNNIKRNSPVQEAARLSATPFLTGYAPTPMTTPMVADYVLLQDARVDSEAARLELELTREAAQAEADRVSGIVNAIDSQRALELARVAQMQELERQYAANELLALRVKEEEGMVTRAALQADVNLQLSARETEVAIDARRIVQVAQAEATATVTAAQAAVWEAEAKRDAGLAVLVLIACFLFFVVLVVVSVIKAYPYAVRLFTEATMREARVTISQIPTVPMPTLTVDPPQVLPPPTQRPIRRPTVIDTSETVNDSIVPRAGGFLDPTAQEFTESEKDRICTEFGIHKYISPTAAAVFGDSNTVRNQKIKAVLIERNILQPAPVAA